MRQGMVPGKGGAGARLAAEPSGAGVLPHLKALQEAEALERLGGKLFSGGLATTTTTTTPKGTSSRGVESGGVGGSVTIPSPLAPVPAGGTTPLTMAHLQQSRAAASKHRKSLLAEQVQRAEREAEMKRMEEVVEADERLRTIADHATLRSTLTDEARRQRIDDISKKAMKQLQQLSDFLNLDRAEPDLKRVASHSAASQPLNLDREIQKRMLPTNLRPSEFFRSNLAAMDHLMEAVQQIRAPTLEQLDEEEQEIYLQAKHDAEATKIIMAQCTCAARLDHAIHAAESAMATKTRMDCTNLFAKMTVAAANMVRTLETLVCEKDQYIDDVTSSNLMLIQKYDALLADFAVMEAETSARLAQLEDEEKKRGKATAGKGAHGNIATTVPLQADNNATSVTLGRYAVVHRQREFLEREARVLRRYRELFEVKPEDNPCPPGTGGFACEAAGRHQRNNNNNEGLISNKSFSASVTLRREGGGSTDPLLSTTVPVVSERDTAGDEAAALPTSPTVLPCGDRVLQDVFHLDAHMKPHEKTTGAQWVQKMLERIRKFERHKFAERELEKQLMAMHDVPEDKRQFVGKAVQTMKEDEVVGSPAWEKKYAALREASELAMRPQSLCRVETRELFHTELLVKMELRKTGFDAAHGVPERVAAEVENVLGSMKELMVAVDYARVAAVTALTELNVREPDKAKKHGNTLQSALEEDMENGLMNIRRSLQALRSAVAESLLASRSISSHDVHKPLTGGGTVALDANQLQHSAETLMHDLPKLVQRFSRWAANTFRVMIPGDMLHELLHSNAASDSGGNAVDPLRDEVRHLDLLMDLVEEAQATQLATNGRKARAGAADDSAADPTNVVGGAVSMALLDTADLLNTLRSALPLSIPPSVIDSIAAPPREKWQGWQEVIGELRRMGDNCKPFTAAVEAYRLGTLQKKKDEAEWQRLAESPSAGNAATPPTRSPRGRISLNDPADGSSSGKANKSAKHKKSVSGAPATAAATRGRKSLASRKDDDGDGGEGHGGGEWDASSPSPFGAFLGLGGTSRVGDPGDALLPVTPWDHENPLAVNVQMLAVSIRDVLFRLTKAISRTQYRAAKIPADTMREVLQLEKEFGREDVTRWSTEQLASLIARVVDWADVMGDVIMLPFEMGSGVRDVDKEEENSPLKRLPSVFSVRNAKQQRGEGEPLVQEDALLVDLPGASGVGNSAHSGSAVATTTATTGRPAALPSLVAPHPVSGNPTPMTTAPPTPESQRYRGRTGSLETNVVPTAVPEADRNRSRGREENADASHTAFNPRADRAIQAAAVAAAGSTHPLDKSSSRSDTVEQTTSSGRTAVAPATLSSPPTTSIPDSPALWQPLSRALSHSGEGGAPTSAAGGTTPTSNHALLPTPSAQLARALPSPESQRSSAVTAAEPHDLPQLVVAPDFAFPSLHASRTEERNETVSGAAFVADDSGRSTGASSQLPAADDGAAAQCFTKPTTEETTNRETETYAGDESSMHQIPTAVVSLAPTASSQFTGATAQQRHHSTGVGSSVGGLAIQSALPEDDAQVPDNVVVKTVDEEHVSSDKAPIPNHGLHVVSGSGPTATAAEAQESGDAENVVITAGPATTPPEATVIIDSTVSVSVAAPPRSPRSNVPPLVVPPHGGGRKFGESPHQQQPTSTTASPGKRRSVTSTTRESSGATRDVDAMRGLGQLVGPSAISTTTTSAGPLTPTTTLSASTAADLSAHRGSVEGFAVATSEGDVPLDAGVTKNTTPRHVAPFALPAPRMEIPFVQLLPNEADAAVAVVVDPDHPDEASRSEANEIEAAVKKLYPELKADLDEFGLSKSVLRQRAVIANRRATQESVNYLQQFCVDVVDQLNLASSMHPAMVQHLRQGTGDFSRVAAHVNRALRLQREHTVTLPVEQWNRLELDKRLLEEEVERLRGEVAEREQLLSDVEVQRSAWEAERESLLQQLEEAQAEADALPTPTALAGERLWDADVGEPGAAGAPLVADADAGGHREQLHIATEEGIGALPGNHGPLRPPPPAGSSPPAHNSRAFATALEELSAIRLSHKYQTSLRRDPTNVSAMIVTCVKRLVKELSPAETTALLHELLAPLVLPLHTSLIALLNTEVFRRLHAVRRQVLLEDPLTVFEATQSQQHQSQQPQQQTGKRLPPVARASARLLPSISAILSFDKNLVTDVVQVLSTSAPPEVRARTKQIFSVVKARVALRRVQRDLEQRRAARAAGKRELVGVQTLREQEFLRRREAVLHEQEAELERLRERCRQQRDARPSLTPSGTSPGLGNPRRAVTVLAPHPVELALVEEDTAASSIIVAGEESEPAVSSPAGASPTPYQDELASRMARWFQHAQWNSSRLAARLRMGRSTNEHDLGGGGGVAKSADVDDAELYETVHDREALPKVLSPKPLLSLEVDRQLGKRRLQMHGSPSSVIKSTAHRHQFLKQLLVQQQQERLFQDVLSTPAAAVGIPPFPGAGRSLSTLQTPGVPPNGDDPPLGDAPSRDDANAQRWTTHFNGGHEGKATTPPPVLHPIARPGGVAHNRMFESNGAAAPRSETTTLSAVAQHDSARSDTAAPSPWEHASSRARSIIAPDLGSTIASSEASMPPARPGPHVRYR